ncbi:hypothetical protein IL306_001086 [Fusarium sp. DS 682]|nr:hypothetical protein IL306_001086 [Fusarium sp. DS 682]
MGREEIQARLKELEEEQSTVDEQKFFREWGFLSSLHAYETDDEHIKPDSIPESMSTRTMKDYPDSDTEGPSTQTQGDQAESVADYAETESSATLRSWQSAHSAASTMAGMEFTPTMGRIGQLIHSDPTGAGYRYNGTGLSEDGRENAESVLGSADVKGKENQDLENSNVNDPNSPNSPLNLSNPHPTLSISTKFLQKAIFDCRKSGTPFVRSILRRDRLDDKESTFADEYSKWKWIPYLVHGLATEPVSTNIAEGDIELICMNNTHFTKMIQNNEPMFEEPRRPHGTFIVREQLKPVFKHPEASGCRVLVWRLHSSKTTFYRDREGHPIPGPAGELPWNDSEAKNLKLSGSSAQNDPEPRESEGFGMRRIPGL